MSDSVLPETQISRLEAKVQEHRSEAVDAKRWALQERTGRHAALSEVDRLRITDAEREVLATVRDIYASHDDDDSCGRIAAVIDALLERHAKGGGA